MCKKTTLKLVWSLTVIVLILGVARVAWMLTGSASSEHKVMIQNSK